MVYFLCRKFAHTGCFGASIFLGLGLEGPGLGYKFECFGLRHLSNILLTLPDRRWKLAGLSVWSISAPKRNLPVANRNFSAFTPVWGSHWNSGFCLEVAPGKVHTCLLHTGIHLFLNVVRNRLGKCLTQEG